MKNIIINFTFVVVLFSLIGCSYSDSSKRLSDKLDSTHVGLTEISKADSEMVSRLSVPIDSCGGSTKEDSEFVQEAHNLRKTYYDETH